MLPPPRAPQAAACSARGCWIRYTFNGRDVTTPVISLRNKDMLTTGKDGSLHPAPRLRDEDVVRPV